MAAKGIVAVSGNATARSMALTLSGSWDDWRRVNSRCRAMATLPEDTLDGYILWKGEGPNATCLRIIGN